MMPQKEESAQPTYTPARTGGSSHNHISAVIIQQHDVLCTAAALQSHEMAHLASATEDGDIMRLARHMERITVELHAIGQVLPAAIMLATLDRGVEA